ncbi:MAG: pyruvate dehydrogenase, partial [Ekhidna sp.]|nr:pyruvate dehydrogenase [Ekhidna sp.]
MPTTAKAPKQKKGTSIDWKEIALKMLISRAMDNLEETKLVPEKKVLYQFSARGHELGQLILANLLDRPKD